MYTRMSSSSSNSSGSGDPISRGQSFSIQTSNCTSDWGSFCGCRRGAYPSVAARNPPIVICIWAYSNMSSVVFRMKRAHQICTTGSRFCYRPGVFHQINIETNLHIHTETRCIHTGLGIASIRPMPVRSRDSPIDLLPLVSLPDEDETTFSCPFPSELCVYTASRRIRAAVR